MNLKQLLSHGGNLVDQLLADSRKDLETETVGLVAYARAQKLLAEIGPLLAEAQEAAAAAQKAAGAAMAESERLNEVWRGLQWQTDRSTNDVTAAEQQSRSDARDAWQAAAAESNRLAGVAREAGADASRLAALASALQSVQRPALVALEILVQEVIHETEFEV